MDEPIRRAVLEVGLKTWARKAGQATKDNRCQEGKGRLCMIEIYHRVVGRKREGDGVFILGHGLPQEPQATT
jgi:hypothetical protein